MDQISSELVESLKIMGLTEYEAKVYSALVLFDRAEVKQIYEFLNVPKPSVYQSLKTLVDKGLVMIVNSKPAIYRAMPPKVALRHLTEVHDKAEKNALKELDYLEKNVLETENSDIIWTLFGENNVEHSMEDLFNKARNSMKIVLPTEYLNFLSFVKEKDINIELLMFGKDSSLGKRFGLKSLRVHDANDLDVSDFGVLPKYFLDYSLLPEDYSKLILVSIDNNEFLYIPPFPGKTKSGVTSKNPHFIGLLNISFTAVWEHTPEVLLE